MTPKRLEEIKKAYFRVQSERYNIPIEYFELPQYIIDKYEKGEEENRRYNEYIRTHRIKIPERVQEFPGSICPRLSRRPVGDFSLLDPDE